MHLCLSVGEYVCECVRACLPACVNFVSNAKQIYSKLVASKHYALSKRPCHLENMDH